MIEQRHRLPRRRSRIRHVATHRLSKTVKEVTRRETGVGGPVLHMAGKARQPKRASFRVFNTVPAPIGYMRERYSERLHHRHEDRFRSRELATLVRNEDKGVNALTVNDQRSEPLPAKPNDVGLRRTIADFSEFKACCDVRDSESL